MVTRDPLSAKLCKAAMILFGVAAGVLGLLAFIQGLRGSVFEGIAAVIVMALAGALTILHIRSASKFSVPLALCFTLIQALFALFLVFSFSFELNIFGGPSRLPAWYKAAEWICLIAGLAAIVGLLLVIGDSLRYLMRQHHAEQVHAATGAVNPTRDGITPAPELPVR